MDDVAIIIMILILVVFSIGIGFLTRRGKVIYDSGESSAFELSTLAQDVSSEGADGAVLDGVQEITVSFCKSSKQYRWIGTKESLLEFAESRGIEVDSLCRAGECGSCRTRLLEGEVEYHKKPAINPGRGYCLLCVSKPKTNLVLKR